MKYLIFSALLPQFLCQFVADLGMKPDVTFGEHNDRFDLTELTEAQNRFFDRHSYHEDDDYRRQGKTIYRGSEDDFGYRSPREEYEENVKKFLGPSNDKSLISQLHEAVKAWRRSNGLPERPTRRVREQLPDPEKEVLMRYAVPVEMTIQGYLQAPLVE